MIPYLVIFILYAQCAGTLYRGRLARGAFSLACLPYEATFSLDAIARAVGRMLITRKRLLEWSPSSAMDRNSRAGLAASFRSMWTAPVIAISTALVLLLSIPAALAVAGPILILWLISPVIAWWISRPLARREARLTAGQTFFLRKLSRKTWAFFEVFVGPEDHWLPPDNYQEYRGPHGGAPHVADQHGTVAARESVRIRLRLHTGRTTHRAHGECIAHDANYGTAPRPFLQLV